MMKHYLCLAPLLFGLNLFAQVGGVSVHLEMAQDQFISNEDAEVIVRVTNRSGQTLKLGNEKDWLTFEVEGQGGRPCRKFREVPVAGDFLLPSSKTATKRSNITPHFDFRDPGRYQVTAYIKIPGIEKPLATKPRAFDVFTGTKLEEYEIGVPPEFLGKSGGSEVRKYVLQQAKYLKDLKLYFRLTDASGGQTIKVFPIAQMVSFSKPEGQIDKFSNLHVLSQVGARAFTYCMLNPDGQLILRQTHEYTETRPVLKLGTDGRVFVKGGVQRISSTDLPPPSNAGPGN